MPSRHDLLAAHDGSRIYVHCQRSVHYAAELIGKLPGLDRYAERALVLAGPRDVVCVTQEVDPAFLAYLAELGLGPSADNVLPVSRFGPDSGATLWSQLAGNREALDALGSRVRGGGPVTLHPFIASPGQVALAAALQTAAGTDVRVAAGDPRLVRYADQKHHIRQRAIELDIPVAEGEVVELALVGGRRRGDFNALRSSVQQLLGRTGRVIVRGSFGAAGSATFVAGEGAEDVDGLIARLCRRTDNRTYLVEVMVQAVVSPNVMLHVEAGDGPISCGGVTDQRWERALVQGGNLFPTCARTTERMIDWSLRMAASLQREGYAGPLGLDFVEYADPETGHPRAFLAEVNPRVNGSTYAAAIFERLNLAQRRAGRPVSQAFASGVVSVPSRSFTELRHMASDVLYSPRSGRGMVPYNLAMLSEGRCGVIMLGSSRETVLRELHAFQTRSRRESG